MNIAYSEVLGVFVAGFGNIWLRSTDGTTWTNYSNANVYINSLFRVDKDGYFYSLYEKMYKSADGITWTLQTSPVTYDLNSVTYSEELNLFVAVGYDGNNYGAILTSSDGNSMCCCLHLHFMIYIFYIFFAITNFTQHIFNRHFAIQCCIGPSKIM